MNAVNPIDQLSAIRRIQEALKTNRNDVGAILELAAMQKEAELKRKLLDRVLSLEPANKTAREMLLEIDRAEIYGGHPHSSLPQPAVPAAPPVTGQFETALVSRYSIIHQILVYPFLVFSILLMFQAFGDWVAFSFVMSCFLLILIPVWFVSAVVQSGASGIGMSRLFGIYRREIEWNEIESIKPGNLGVGMRLTASGGGSLTISSQMSRYPAIVEILRQLRPDLFSLPGRSSSSEPGAASGSKSFQKGFLGKYGLLFASIILSVICLFMLLLAQIIPAIFLGIFVFFLWNGALYQVHTVKLAGDRLTITSLRSEQELATRQIKDIRMVTRYSRRGVATNLIQIELLSGNNFSLSGFPEGNEIMYSFLRNRWSAHRNI